MTGTDVAIKTIGFTAGAGAYSIVRAIIKNNVVPGGVFARITVFVGGMAIALIVENKVELQTQKLLYDFIAKVKHDQTLIQQ